MADYDLGQYGAEIVLNDKNFTKNMDNAEKQMGSFDKGATKFGASLGTLASGAIAGLGVALVGAGVAGVKMADNLDKALNGLQASTGATDKEMKGMEDSLKNIYNNNFGESFADIADSMALVKQNTGLAGKELEQATQTALMLRDTFGKDVTESTNTANSLMKQFGITSDEAFNLMAQGIQNGADKNGDFLESLNEYAPQFKSMGFNAEEFTNVLIDGAKNGAFSIDKVGDAIKEFNIRAKDGSKTTIDAFQSLGLNADQMGSSFAQGGEKGREAFQTVMTALNNVKDPMEKNRIGVQLFGTQYEDLEAKGIAAFANIGNSATLSKDALEQINQVKYNSFGEALTGIGRNLQTGLLLPLGEKLLPFLNQFSSWLTEKIPVMQQFFSDLFSSGQSSFEGISQVVSNVINYLKPLIMDYVTEITTWWKQNGDELLANAKTIFDGIMSVVNFVMPFIKLVIENTMNSVKNIVGGVLDMVSAIFKMWGSLLRGDWEGLWEGIKDYLSGWVKMLKGLLTANFSTAILRLFSDFGTNLKNLFFNTWESVKTTFYNAGAFVWQTAKGLKNNVVSTIGTLRDNVMSTFESIKTFMQDPIKNATTFIKEQIDKIVGFFSGMKIEFPKIKLPHFSLKGEFSLSKMTVPTVGVDWYKHGGFFTQPSIIGVGEAGKEAVVPLVGSQMDPFADAVYRRLAQKMNHGGSSVTNSNQTINFSPIVNFDVKGGLTRNDMDQAANYMLGTLSNRLKSLGVASRR
jgi:TP901 family phage tail tape measure protein